MRKNRIYKRIMEDVSRVIRKHLNKNTNSVNMTDETVVAGILKQAILSDKLPLIGKDYENYMVDMYEAINYLYDYYNVDDDDELTEEWDYILSELYIDDKFGFTDPDALHQASYGGDGMEEDSDNIIVYDAPLYWTEVKGRERRRRGRRRH